MLDSSWMIGQSQRRFVSRSENAKYASIKPKWRICRSRCTVKMVLITRFVNCKVRVIFHVNVQNTLRLFVANSFQVSVLSNISYFQIIFSGNITTAGMDAMSVWQGVIFPCVGDIYAAFCIFSNICGTKNFMSVTWAHWISAVTHNRSEDVKCSPTRSRWSSTNVLILFFLFLGHCHRRTRQRGSRSLWKWVSWYEWGFVYIFCVKSVYTDVGVLF